jgi:hypothetical protein
MNTATKLLEAMGRNPLDWRIEQLQAVARQHGSPGARRVPAIASSFAPTGGPYRYRRIGRSSRIYVKRSVALVKGG